MNKLEQFSSLFNNFRSRIIQNDRWNYTKGKKNGAYFGMNLFWANFESEISLLSSEFSPTQVSNFRVNVGRTNGGNIYFNALLIFHSLQPSSWFSWKKRLSSIYQYSNMVRGLSGQTIFGVVSLCPSLFWELREKISLKILQFWPESRRAMFDYYVTYCVFAVG